MDEALEGAIEAAHTALDEDRPGDAYAVLERALAGAEASSPELRAEALGLAAVAARAEGDARRARELSELALALAGAERELLADLLEDRAEIELALRAPASAAAHLRRAIALREPSDAETWMALADALLRAGEHDAVEGALSRAEPLASRDGDGETLALVSELRGDVALALADAATARSAYSGALARWRAQEDDAGCVRALLGAARAAELEDDREGILAALAALESIEPGVEGRAEALDEVRDLVA